MAKVKVLIEGYAREEDDIEFASSTTTLIQEADLNIIVDPGMNRELLLETLRKENLFPDKINYVILTHNHLDHSLLTGLFEKAKIFDNEDVYSWDGKIESHKGKIPGTDIEIIKTPGHDMFHCSVLVQDENFGKVAIAGDVFWWQDSQEQKTDKESLIELQDSYVKSKEDLINSRKKILAFADYIIPGHGKPFKVEK